MNKLFLYGNIDLGWLDISRPICEFSLFVCVRLFVNILKVGKQDTLWWGGWDHGTFVPLSDLFNLSMYILWEIRGPSIHSWGRIQLICHLVASSCQSWHLGLRLHLVMLVIFIVCFSKFFLKVDCRSEYVYKVLTQVSMIWFV